MESLNNEDEFCWPSLSHGTEGPDDEALKSDFKFSSAEASSLKNIPDYNMDLNDNIEGLPILDCDKKPSPFDKNLGSEMDVDFRPQIYFIINIWRVRCEVEYYR